MSNVGNEELPLFPVPVGMGAGRSAFSLAEKDNELPKKKKSKDPIGEPEYDPWVYNFSKDNMPALDRSVNRMKDAPPYGWHPSNSSPNQPAWGSTDHNGLVQKRDIGDSGIDEEVHGFAANDKSVLPQPWRRVKEAYPANGVFNPKFAWLDKPAAFAQ